MDGISNVYALTAQINSLSSLDTESLQNPDAVKYTLEQNFSRMLNDLISATDNDDDEKDKDKNADPFGFLMQSNQTYIEHLVSRNTADDSSEQNLVNDLLNQNSNSYLNSLYLLQDNVLALQLL